MWSGSHGNDFGFQSRFYVLVTSVVSVTKCLTETKGEWETAHHSEETAGRSVSVR